MYDIQFPIQASADPKKHCDNPAHSLSQVRLLHSFIHSFIECTVMSNLFISTYKAIAVDQSAAHLKKQKQKQ